MIRSIRLCVGLLATTSRPRLVGCVWYFHPERDIFIDEVITVVDERNNSFPKWYKALI